MDQWTALTEEFGRRCPSLELRPWEPMSRHTSFRIGGPVRLMALPRSEDEAVQAVAAAHQLGIVPFFMGNGSNLLVADQGWDGLVIKTFDGLSGLHAEGESVEAGSGVLLSRLARFALEHALDGLEFAHGIPGSLGGAITMNAGAYGGEMRQVVDTTTFLDRSGSLGVLRGEEHQFAYRHSAFSGGERLILRVRMVLKRGEPAEIQANMDDLARRRREKQPLDLPSAGSTFKRPEGHFAAALIEACGLKGTVEGGAQVSEKHAGFLVNRGGASCADVLRLADRVRETVFAQTGVTLELEIRTLGCRLDS